MKLFIITLGALITLSALCPLSYALILNVPDDYQNIQEAINASHQQDTVLLQPGEYRESLTLETVGLVIGSLLLTTGDSTYIPATVIDGNQQPGIFYFATAGESFEVRGLTLRNCDNHGLGGVFLVGNSNHVLLQDLRICDNRSSQQTFSGIVLGAVNAFATFKRCEIFNNISNMDGSIFHAYNTAFSFEDCRIVSNQPNITVFFLGNCSMEMNRVLLADNHAEDFADIEIYEQGVWSQDVNYTFDHVTLINEATEDGEYGAALVVSSQEDISVQLTVTNSIITSTNTENPYIFLSQSQGSDLISSFKYNDIYGGEDIISMEGDPDHTWDDNNLDEDPLFIDPGNLDFHLQANSPCRDTGNPDSTPDPDGSRTDMGAFPYENRFGFIGGRVIDAETREPVAGASIIARNVEADVLFDYIARSDAEGYWGSVIYSNSEAMMVFNFETTSPAYLTNLASLELNPGDSISYNFEMLYAVLEFDDDTTEIVVDSSRVGRLDLLLGNTGNGPLRWTASGHASGDEGLPKNAIRKIVEVGAITADDRIYGVAFDGENYYFAGSNGDDPNTIYILNSAGDLVNSFVQPGNSVNGFRDLEMDGEVIWGSNEQTIFGFRNDGEVNYQWAGPYATNANIAFDPVEEVLWIGGLVNDPVAYDREGNALGGRIDRGGHTVFGLGWIADSDETHKLLMLCKDGNQSPPTIIPRNVADGTEGEPIILKTQSNTLSGLFASQTFDGLGSWVVMNTARVPVENGGDLLEVRQYKRNEEWLTLESDTGKIEANSQQIVPIVLRTVAEDSSWALRTGIYYGELVFESDGRGDSRRLPVKVQVNHYNEIPSEDVLIPGESALSAFPNPFNSTTTISFSVRQASLPVRLAIYDLSGRLVTDLVTGKNDYHPGQNKVVWNADSLPGGIYLIRLESGNESRAIKTLLLK